MPIHAPIAALLACAPQAALPADSIEPEFQAIVRIVEVETEEPVVGATVWWSLTFDSDEPDVIPLPESTTDDQGFARADMTRWLELSPIEREGATFTGYVVHPEYLTGRVYTEALTQEEIADDYFSFAVLERGRSILGRVVDLDGRPVPRAKMTFGLWNASTEEFDVEFDGSSNSIWSDEDGRVSFDVPAGDVPDAIDVFAWHPFVGLGRTRVTLEGDEQAPFAVRLEPSPYRLRARGELSDGAPAGSIPIDLSGSTKTPWIPKVFEFPVEFADTVELQVPVAGSWELRCSGAWGDEVNHVEIAGNTQQANEALGSLSFVVPPNLVRIHVVDAEGSPVRSAFIRIGAVDRTDAGAVPTPREISTARHFRTATDMPKTIGGGSYSYFLPRGGSWGISARLWRPGGGAWLAETVVESNPDGAPIEVRLTLRDVPAGGTVQFNPVRPDGQPVESFHGLVASLGSGVELTGFDALGTDLSTSMGASFEPVRLLQGRYVARIQVDGFETAEVLLDVEAGQDAVVEVPLR